MPCARTTSSQQPGRIRTAKVLLRELVLLNHGAHGTVEHNDALLHLPPQVRFDALGHSVRCSWMCRLSMRNQSSTAGQSSGSGLPPGPSDCVYFRFKVHMYVPTSDLFLLFTPTLASKSCCTVLNHDSSAKWWHPTRARNICKPNTLTRPSKHTIFSFLLLLSIASEIISTARLIFTHRRRSWSPWQPSCRPPWRPRPGEKNEEQRERQERVREGGREKKLDLTIRPR